VTSAWRNGSKLFERRRLGLSETHQPTDQELLQQIREAGEGDLRAFQELVRRYQGKVTTNCRYLSGSPDDAEDLAQEVFMKVYFGLAGFEGRSSFQTWVHRIKSNHCINFVKKKRLQTVGLDTPGVEGASGVPPRAERELEKEAMQARVGSVLLQMSETLRTPLVLRDMDGMSYEEVAQDLGIGLSAVKMRIKRGREEFRRLFDGELTHE
jgi:RNA polymerase sigma-70 factor (ECF subfamily)